VGIIRLANVHFAAFGSLLSSFFCYTPIPVPQNAKTQLSAHLRVLKAEHRCLVLGMTGTLMQNKHEELWNLIDLVETDFLGSWSEFQQDVANPIKIGR
jgi:SNF2-related domain